MSALKQEYQRYSLPEYLALEEQANYKSEYHQGYITAMAGASLDHNQITSNLLGELYQALAGKGCRVFSSDLRVWVEAKARATYPDITVVCGRPELMAGRNDTIINPTVIIEVLSKSTAFEDKGDKFQAYWALNSLAEYVIVDQYQPRVEYFRWVNEKQWDLRVLTKLEDTLLLPALGIEVSLAKIYAQVSWGLE